MNSMLFTSLRSPKINKALEDKFSRSYQKLLLFFSNNRRFKNALNHFAPYIKQTHNFNPQIFICVSQKSAFSNPFVFETEFHLQGRMCACVLVFFELMSLERADEILSP